MRRIAWRVAEVTDRFRRRQLGRIPFKLAAHRTRPSAIVLRTGSNNCVQWKLIRRQLADWPRRPLCQFPLLFFPSYSRNIKILTDGPRTFRSLCNSFSSNFTRVLAFNPVRLIGFTRDFHLLGGRLRYQMSLEVYHSALGARKNWATCYWRHATRRAAGETRVASITKSSKLVDTGGPRYPQKELGSFGFDRTVRRCTLLNRAARGSAKNKEKRKKTKKSR